MKSAWIAGGALLLGMPLAASATVIDYEDLAEGFYGETFAHRGVTYADINLVAGVFPDGSTFDPGFGDNVVVEDASILYDDFPTWGSADKALTFGQYYVNGDNLSLGALSTVTMLLDTPSDSASMDIAFYENGPWGGIVFHLDAINNGSVVASDTRPLSDLGGRDNIAFDTLMVSGATFDELHLYATYGSEYSLPRLLMDNLSLNPVPAPPTALLLGGIGVASRRRRRR